MDDLPQPPDGEPSRNLVRRMTEAARDLQDRQGAELTYEMATGLAMTNVAGCVGASLSMVRKGHSIDNRAATTADARWADELQVELGEGPCLQATWDGPLVYSPSLAYDQRWPAWGRRVVAQTGLHSVLSLQLFTRANVLGALNLYGVDKDAFTAEAHDEALALASHVATAIAAAEKIGHLDTALRSRTVTGQATGMLMERYGLDADTAFSLLARVSSTEQVKIRDLAETLTRTGKLPQP